MKPNSRIDWRKAATRLAAAIPRERLDPAVAAWADSTDSRRTWGVAFSGGADSLALLLLVWAHWPERRRRILALHFDHRLRGAESRADAAFCTRVCAGLGVRLVLEGWNRGTRVADRGAVPMGEEASGVAGVSEAGARAARHAFLGRNARAIWMGHQMDDVAESMLMRLARGSGTAGLAAPRPLQPAAGGRTHLRPLLTLKKAEIVRALQEAGIPWREDSSNALRAFLRNRMRHDVIAHWETAARRDAVAGAARSRALLEEDDAALEGWATGLRALDNHGALILKPLAGMPRAIVRRVLHRWLLRQRGAGELSRQAFEALLAVVEAGRPTRMSLGRSGFAVLRHGVLCFEAVRGKPRTFRGRAN